MNAPHLRRTGLFMLLLVGITLGFRWTTQAADKKPADPAVERARREVKMLDDLYKTAVVLITETYVKDESSVSAGEAAQKIFAAMKKNGWHDARLLDASGKPVNAENKPKDEFERTAIKHILAGEPQYDEVVKEGDKRFLRAVTVVPCVSQKCTLCHAGFKVGDVMGGIGYKIPVTE